MMTLRTLDDDAPSAFLADDDIEDTDKASPPDIEGIFDDLSNKTRSASSEHHAGIKEFPSLDIEDVFDLSSDKTLTSPNHDADIKEPPSLDIEDIFDLSSDNKTSVSPEEDKKEKVPEIVGDEELMEFTDFLDDESDSYEQPGKDLLDLSESDADQKTNSLEKLFGPDSQKEKPLNKFDNIFRNLFPTKMENKDSSPWKTNYPRFLPNSWRRFWSM